MSTNLDVEQELSLFIENYVDSFVKWDLIAFFGLNPETESTAIDIASRLGRKEEDVKQALEELVQKGLLEKRENEDVVYSYAPNEELARQARLFVECLEDRNKRLKILGKLLRRNRGR